MRSKAAYRGDMPHSISRSGAVFFTLKKAIKTALSGIRKATIFLFALLIGIAILDALKINGLVVLIGMAVAFWYWTLRRGLLTVRAFMYLGMLSNGITPMEANWRVFKVGYLAGSNVAPAAKSFIRQHYDGKQLPLIAEARTQGFVG